MEDFNNNALTIILIDAELELNNNSNKNINIQDSEINISIPEFKNLSNNIKEFHDINEAMDEIKKLKFNETIIIVNKKKFVDFVIMFNKNINDICIIPKIIIFSESKSQKLKLPNDIQNKNFYTFFGIKNRKEIKDFLKKEAEENNKELIEDYPKASPYTDSELIFQFIKRRPDLLLSLFYTILLDISETNNYLFIEAMKSYKNNANYKTLFNPIISCKDIPIELLSKYYARIYTVDGNFSLKMKRDILKDYNKANIIYQPYIKTIYEGLELKALKPLTTFEGIQLYNAQYFTEKQLEELNEYRLMTVDYYEFPILISRIFLSFSKDISIAEHTMNSYIKKIL